MAYNELEYANELLAGLFQIEDEMADFGLDLDHFEDLIELSRSIGGLHLERTDSIELDKKRLECFEFHNEFGCDTDNFYSLWNVCMDILSRMCHPLPDDDN